MTKSEREMYGVTGKPMKATRVLVKDMDHDFGGQKGQCLIVIDDTKGTFTAANVYDGKLKRGYDPKTLVHQLPAKDSERWKDWTKRGYKPAEVADFPCLEKVEVEQTV